MKPWDAWVAHLGLAGMCLIWFGCGGSDIPDPDSDPHAAKGAAPPAASSPPPAVAETVTPAPEATAKPAPAVPAAKPEPAPAEAVAKTEPVPAPAEPKKVEAGPAPEPKAQTPSATTEMLALGSAPKPPAAPPNVDGAQANQAPVAPDNGIQNASGAGAAAQQHPPANFRDPVSATMSFLAALKAKDLDVLAEATALHAPTEATGKNQNLFSAILDQSLSPEDLEELVKSLDGYRIVGQNTPKSTGRIGIILAKQEGTSTMLRHVDVRHEKKGWKVVDISGKREMERPIVRPRMPGYGGAWSPSLRFLIASRIAFL
jgi:hypothetical protein